MSGLTEGLKIRCPIEDCRSIVVPAGVDFTGEDVGDIVPAGVCKIFGALIAMNMQDFAVDDSDLSLAASTWLTYIPKVIVAKTAHASARPWVQGEDIHYDGSEFTDLTTNLNAIGYATLAVLSAADEGEICFMGDNIAMSTDIVSGS